MSHVIFFDFENDMTGGIFSRNPVKILVVEDEAIIARDIQNILKKFGFGDPETASSGEESIRKASEIRPDLVLMDIKLKGRLDGLEAAHEIRNKFRIPVIFLTAYGDENTMEKVQTSGPFSCIQKPFEEKELEAIIRKALLRNRN